MGFIIRLGQTEILPPVLVKVVDVNVDEAVDFVVKLLGIVIVDVFVLVLVVVVVDVDVVLGV